MKKVREVFNPFERPVTKVEAVVTGSLSCLNGLPGVFVGKERTFAICNLIPVRQEGVGGGIWKIESRLQRPSYYFLIASEARGSRSGYGRIITTWEGKPLPPIPKMIAERLGLWDDRLWLGAPMQLVVLEANEFDDTVMLRHCHIVQQEGVAYLREKYLSLVGHAEILQVGYHTYNGDLSKFVAQELGSLASLSDAIIAALDKAHCISCAKGLCSAHFFLPKS